MSNVETLEANASASASTAALSENNAESAKEDAEQGFADFHAGLDGVPSLSGENTRPEVHASGSFPVTPEATPTEDYQTSNKKYVEEEIWLQWHTLTKKHKMP